MKIPGIFLSAVLLLYGAVLQGKSLMDPPPPVSVTEKPSFGPSWFNSGPTLKTFRCTNRTLSPVTIQIEIQHPYHKNKKSSILSTHRIPGVSSVDVSVLVPRISDLSGTISFEARTDNGIKVDTKKSHLQGDCSKIASRSFTPDFFTYVLEENGIIKAPLPVREWSADSRAYAGLDLIMLDSEDILSPGVKQALRLAAARGTRILVLVRGNAPWPSYAGTEQKGRAFEEKIGFGTWIVMRTEAADTNPAWNDFVKRKYNAAKSGTGSSRYKAAFKWQEAKLFHYLNYISPIPLKMKQVTLAQPPVPIRQLTLIMIVFVIVIGPVNFLILKKRHAEMWCLVTIPALSLLFSGAVILCVFITEGISSKGKGEVETILDQTTGTAATCGGFAVYSPVNIGDFKFASNDMLYFLKPGKVQGVVTPEGYTYSNLVPPRTSFSYAVCCSGERSEKIAVTEKEGTVTIVNGLGVKVDSLFLRDSQGTLFKLGSPLAPGARAVLPKIPRLPAGENYVKKGFYRARVSEPLFITPGTAPDKYEHKQTVDGRWR